MTSSLHAITGGKGRVVKSTDITEVFPNKRFLCINSRGEFRMKDNLKGIWYTFDTEEERTLKIAELLLEGEIEQCTQ